MPLTETLKSTWSRFFASAAYEKDPGFREVILRLSSKGMVAVGALGCVTMLAYLGLHAAAGYRFGWVYPPPPKTIVMWDNLAILALSIAMLGLARTRFGPRWGRLLVASAFVVAGIGLALDNVAVQEVSTTAGYLSFLLLLAVGVMPYHLWQALVFGLAMVVVYFAGIWSLPAVLEVEAIALGARASYLMIIVPIVCTGISALLYNSRYEQYLAHRKAEQLKDRLERAYRSLEESLQLLTETQDQLIHAEKMASLGQLAAGIAHEMRNPLNFVNNFADLSLELFRELRATLEAQKDKTAGEILEDVDDLLSDLEHNTAKINEHGKRAEGIVRSMIQHARSASGERQATNLNALLDEHVNLAYYAMRAQQPGFTATIECHYDDAVGYVELVSQEMGRVFVNLLNNAFYAVLERTRAGDSSFVAMVKVTTRKEGDTVEIRVCDNGPGISEEVKDKVFEPFFTTKPTGTGTGLGLSLSYDIVTQGHGGTLTVESKEGEGATFVITLPSDSRT